MWSCRYRLSVFFTVKEESVSCVVDLVPGPAADVDFSLGEAWCNSMIRYSEIPVCTGYVIPVPLWEQ